MAGSLVSRSAAFGAERLRFAGKLLVFHAGLGCGLDLFCIGLQARLKIIAVLRSHPDKEAEQRRDRQRDLVGRDLSRPAPVPQPDPDRGLLQSTPPSSSPTSTPAPR